MKSLGVVLKVKPGCEAEYKKRHDELWPEMAEVMKAAGINMVIYRHENLLFIYGSAPSQAAWDQVDNHPVTPRWDKYMAEVMEVDPEKGTPWIKELPQMFKFGNLG